MAIQRRNLADCHGYGLVPSPFMVTISLSDHKIHSHLLHTTTTFGNIRLTIRNSNGRYCMGKGTLGFRFRESQKVVISMDWTALEVWTERYWLC